MLWRPSSLFPRRFSSPLSSSIEADEKFRDATTKQVEVRKTNREIERILFQFQDVLNDVCS